MRQFFIVLLIFTVNSALSEEHVSNQTKESIYRPLFVKDSDFLTHESKYRISKSDFESVYFFFESAFGEKASELGYLEELQKNNFVSLEDFRKPLAYSLLLADDTFINDFIIKSIQRSKYKDSGGFIYTAKLISASSHGVFADLTISRRKIFIKLNYRTERYEYSGVNASSPFEVMDSDGKSFITTSNNSSKDLIPVTMTKLIEYENDVYSIKKKNETEFDSMNIDISPSNEAPIISILFLHERNLSTAEAHLYASQAMLKLRNMFIQSGIQRNWMNYSFQFARMPDDNQPTGYREGVFLTPEGFCGRNSQCQLSYIGSLQELVENQTIRQLRKEWKADLLIFLRTGVEWIGTNVARTGLANHIPTNTSMDYARNAIAVAYKDVDSVVHEIAHLIGAGHSVDNSNPGPGYAKAFNGSFYHTQGCPTAHRHGVKSFMEYKHVCDNKWASSYPAIGCGSYPGCYEVDRFSKSGEVIYIDDANQSVPYGDFYSDNARALSVIAPAVIQYDQYIEGNSSPIAEISRTRGSNILNQEQCFNAVGTSDPNGQDDIVFMSMEAKDSKGRVLSQKRLYDVSDEFCFTPQYEGRFLVSLIVKDKFDWQDSTTLNLDIKDDPNWVDTPFLSLNSKSKAYYYLSWNEPLGHPSYYEVYVSHGSNKWRLDAVSNDRTEYYSYIGRDGLYKYKVRACTSTKYCSSFSNERSIQIGEDDNQVIAYDLQLSKSSDVLNWKVNDPNMTSGYFEIYQENSKTGFMRVDQVSVTAFNSIFSHNISDWSISGKGKAIKVCASGFTDCGPLSEVVF